jgi:hypothetical protein
MTPKVIPIGVGAWIVQFHKRVIIPQAIQLRSVMGKLEQLLDLGIATFSRGGLSLLFFNASARSRSCSSNFSR